MMRSTRGELRLDSLPKKNLHQFRVFHGIHEDLPRPVIGQTLQELLCPTRGHVG